MPIKAVNGTRRPGIFDVCVMIQSPRVESTLLVKTAGHGQGVILEETQVPLAKQCRAVSWGVNSIESEQAVQPSSYGRADTLWY